MKIVVHFGSPKTGSTAIQTSLHESRQHLEEMGFLYPSIAGRIDHTALLPKKTGEASHKWDFNADAWAEFTDTAKRSKPQTLILSSEYIYNRPGMRRALTGRLRRLSSDITYIGYIRPPKPRYLSGLQQWIKFTSAIISPAKPLPYREKVAQFLRVPVAKLQLRAFERCKLNRGNVVFDFLTAAAGMPAEMAEHIPTLSANESVSAEGMVLLQKVNALVTNGDRKTNFHSDVLLKAVHVVEANGSFSKPRLHDHVQTIIDQVNNADMVWLKKEMGISFSDAVADECLVIETPPTLPPDLQMSDLIEFDHVKLAAMEDRVLVELLRRQKDVDEAVELMMAIGSQPKPQIAAALLGRLVKPPAPPLKCSIRSEIPGGAVEHDFAPGSGCQGL